MTLFDWLVVTIIFCALAGLYVWIGNKILSFLEAFWQNW